MQKFLKYIIISIIAVLILGTGFITGCAYSRRTVAEMADRNIELQKSIDNYSATVESLKSEGVRLNTQIRGLNRQIIEFGDRLSEYNDLSREFTDDLGSIHGEISHSRQGIQDIEDGLGRIDSGFQSYIGRAENP